jgi:hypothetical protein
MATYQTYQEVGLREDISDVITNISPRKTPFLSSLGSDTVTQPLFQWQEDSLRAVQTNAQVEGADATFITVNPTVMRNNYTQIFTEAVQVSGSAEKALAHGRAREMAYQMAKSSAQVKRDLENALVGTAQASAAGGAAVARTMAGYQQQVAAANVTYVNTTTATPLNEASLVANIQQCFTQGSDPSRIMVTPSNSVVLAGFASAAGRYRTIPTEIKAASGTIVNAVNLYVSPFGEQKVELNRFLRAHNTLVFEPDMWQLATFRAWARESLAKTGDSIKQMIVGEFSLKHKNFQASGIVVDTLLTGF